MSQHWHGGGTAAGASKDHGFTYDFAELAVAAELYIDSERRHLPTRDEVRRLDKTWVREVGELASMIMNAKPKAGDVGDEDGA